MWTASSACEHRGEMVPSALHQPAAAVAAYICNMHAIAVSIGVHCYSFHSQTPCCANHTARDLAAIGNQYLVEHGG